MPSVEFSKTEKLSFKSKKKPKSVKFSKSSSFTQEDFLKRAEKRNLIYTPTIDRIVGESKKWIRENTFRVSLPCIVAADFHIPHTSTDWLKYLTEVADTRDIETLIVAGDFFDQDQFKVWMDTGIKVDWDTELQAGKEVIDSLLKQFDKIYFILGNHDVRLFRQLGSRFDIKNVFSQMVSLALIGNRILVSNIKYLLTEDGKWIICHPSNYSRDAIKSPLNVIAVEHKNVICGHGHHFGAGNDVSGKYTGVDCGGMFSEDSMTYNGSTTKSNHPKWKNGFVLLSADSKLRLYSDDYEW